MRIGTYITHAMLTAIMSLYVAYKLSSPVLSIHLGVFVPEGMCMVGLTEDEAGYFIHDNGRMIPRNDVLIVLSLPPG